LQQFNTNSGSNPRLLNLSLNFVDKDIYGFVNNDAQKDGSLLHLLLYQRCCLRCWCCWWCCFAFF